MYTYKFVHMHMYVYIHIYMHMYIYMDTYIHIFIYIYIHTCICIYIYARMYVQSLVRVTEWPFLITSPPHRAFDGNLLREPTYAWKVLIEQGASLVRANGARGACKLLIWGPNLCFWTTPLATPSFWRELAMSTHVCPESPGWELQDVALKQGQRSPWGKCMPNSIT